MRPDIWDGRWTDRLTSPLLYRFTVEPENSGMFCKL